eukprot:TRINITY_DN276_c0_g1_i1.p1 TRINITY_DN276_c0_g1~~TRINITY_DN276_c0_g1_i1.p1  ORF type:complete len:935 (+),score=333.85 TRINITY_DN276_c0_g1_i1:60-2807(+)
MRQLCMLLLAASGNALVQLPSWISDNMVLQTNSEYGARARFNGLADPNEVVTIEDCGVTYKVTADSQGEWVVSLTPCYATDPRNATITGATGDVHTINNILQGDVYFCSGQSNMDFPLLSAINGSAESDTLRDSHYAGMRFFNTPKSWSCQGPRFDVNHTGQCTASPCSSWVTAAEAMNSGYIHDFSAVCFLSARDVQRIHTASRPIGVVMSDVGGSRIAAWMPKEAFALCPDFEVPIVGNPIDHPSALYDDMVHPFRYMSVRAAIWYQGEANAGQPLNATVVRTDYYACMQQALIKSWRQAKQMGDFPFVAVQVAPSVESGGNESIPDGTIDVRIATSTILPHAQGPLDITGMAIAYDMPGAWNSEPVHPPNKKPIGKRVALQLARIAFAQEGRLTNDKADTVPPEDQWTSYWTGPLFQEAVRVSATSVKIVFVEDTAFGLALQDMTGINSDLTADDCTLCCAKAAPFEVFVSGGWQRVAQQDTVLADNATTVLLQNLAEGVSEVRYAYANYVECVLRSSDGLPLGPFVANVSESVAPVVQKQSAGDKPAASAARTAPPMGYNTWNFYHTNVDENIIKGIVDAMSSNGLLAAGYEYVNIDDGWQIARNASGTIVADSVRFPSGMKYLADYTHNHMMKFGLYTSSSSLTCQKRPGSYGSEQQDAQTYCAWGLDYIKIDSCGGTHYTAINSSWIPFHTTLAQCGRPVLMSVEYCKSPTGCGEWVHGCADMWRTTGDIQATWDSVLANFRGNNLMASVAGPGKFNDPDMLQVGNAGLSYNEQVSHFSLWCVVSAPLLIATDVVNIAQETLDIFINTEAIAVNQDLGLSGQMQGVSVVDNSTALVVVKHLSDKTVAAVLVNPTEGPADVSATWGQLGLAGMQVARDILMHGNVGTFNNTYTARQLPAHGAAFILFTGA